MAVSVQAAIEGIGIMLQRSTAPPPSGMPMDMPTVDTPKPPSEVLIGGEGPSVHATDPNVLLHDAKVSEEPVAKKGWFGFST
jgi:hypothetical protein